jgi:hypothetical protein
MFLNNLMQSDIHVFCHSSLIAADEEMGAGLKPIKNLFALFEQAMLHVNLIRLVSGESSIESGQNPLLLEPFELLFVKEVALVPLLAEEKPVFAGSANSAAFFQVGPERS